MKQFTINNPKPGYNVMEFLWNFIVYYFINSFYFEDNLWTSILFLRGVYRQKNTMSTGCLRRKIYHKVIEYKKSIKIP